MKALILAAGRGERLRPLTDTLPKPMIPILGKPVLEHLILLCKAHGINEIAINTSYLPEKIKQYFGSGEKWGVKLYFSHEPEMLGTSGALNNFRDFLDDTFVVIYGDNVTDTNLKEMVAYHKSKKGIATLALRKKTMDPTSGGFVLIDKNSQIKRFYEKSSKEELKGLDLEKLWKNSGMYVLESGIMDYVPRGFSDFGKDIFPKLLESGEKLFSYDIGSSYFREVGKIEKYKNAKREIESKLVTLNFHKDKAIFLDRDGVLNEIIYEVDGRIMSPAKLDQVKIIEGVKEGIKKFKDVGFKIIGISNQPGVALGYLNEKELKRINESLKKELDIDEIYYCPHHPKITGECNCRKPQVELIERAKKDFNLDVKNSYFVGDSLSDIQTGKNAQVKKTFMVGVIREDILELQHRKGIFPDFTSSSLIEVADKIGEIELL